MSSVFILVLLFHCASHCALSLFLLLVSVVQLAFAQSVVHVMMITNCTEDVNVIFAKKGKRILI